MRHGLDRITLADLLRGGGDIGELVRSRLAQVVFDPQPPLLTLSPLVHAVVEPAVVPAWKRSRILSPWRQVRHSRGTFFRNDR